MRKRSREEEAERQRRRRSKGRSNRRTLKDIIIDDEETLRKALKAEGIHVTLSLEYAVIEKLRRMCNEYKRGQAAEAWKAVAHLPAATTGILPRLREQDEERQGIPNLSGYQRADAWEFAETGGRRHVGRTPRLDDLDGIVGSQRRGVSES